MSRALRGHRGVNGARLGLVCLAVLFSGATGRAEEAATSPRGPLQDPFLQNLVGDWSISRKIRGTVVANTMKAEWVLQHQFVQLHMKDVANPPAYEALVLIGYDAGTGRYVAHWCDSFGAEYAGVGYGKRVGNSVDFVFSYADGPFHNTFSWDPATSTWTFLMEAENKDGARRFFAEDTVRRK